MAGFQNTGDDFAPISDINVTPLVDVMLVLLIIFMVTTPLLESGIRVELPKASARALPKDSKPMILSITKDQKFYLNDSLVKESDFITAIQVTFKKRTDKQLFIRADGSLRYGFIAQVMSAIKEAGIVKIGLVTLPPKKKAQRRK